MRNSNLDPIMYPEGVQNGLCNRTVIRGRGRKKKPGSKIVRNRQINARNGIRDL